MNIINCMNIQILIVNIIIIRNNYDVVGGLVMGLSEKSGWGLKFSTLEPPGNNHNNYKWALVRKGGKIQL